jgi:hypothetical protein
MLTEQKIRTFVGEQNLLKGQQYVRDGAIIDPVKQGMSLKAYCYGSLPEPYRVQVIFDDTGISTALCSCPVGTPLYGSRGCEHAAALLLTWQEQAATFVEMDDLDIILERKDKSELIALIKQLLVKQPEVTWQLTMSPPTGKRKIPLDPEVYRHQVAAAFRPSGGRWDAVYDISDELFGIKHIGDRFARQHDYAQAATIYEEVVMGVIKNISGYHDEGGMLGHVVSMTIKSLDELLTGGQCDKMTREKVFQTLFAIFHFDVEMGELGLKGEASEVMLKHATTHERPLIADWTYLVNSQVQGSEWSIERHCQQYGAFLLSLAGEEITDELFLHICHETRRYSDVVERLLVLGRADEAATEAGFASDRELLGMIDLFIQSGHDDVAERVMLERSKQSQNMPILEWLKQHYWANNNYTTALELAESMFRTQPSIENYRDMRQLAGYLDRWETLRPEVLSFLKTSRNALVLTQIALDEGDIESALALVKSQARRSSTSRNDRQIYTYDLGYNKVVFDVARVAEDSRPHAAIEIYEQHVERLLDMQNRSNYRAACEYLMKIRALYEKLDDSEGWINYVTDLRKRTNRLRSFKEELANAGL